MANKIINSRVVSKHDTAANWAKATSFVPLAGEIIVYTDGSGGETTPQVKIGDGVNTVGSLPFTNGDYLAKSGGTMTGDLTVNANLTSNTVKVTNMATASSTITNVLTQDTDNIVKKRSADTLLEDIGGISYGINDSTGVLSLKFGKQS